MPAILEFVLAIVMLAGVLGTLLPLVPGIWLTWLGFVLWAGFDGGGSTRWQLAGVATVLAVGGWLANFLIPAGATVRSPNSQHGWFFGAIGALIGCIAIPIVGAILGYIAGVYFAESASGASPEEAWTRTRAAVIAFGIATVVQVLSAAAIFGLFLLGLLRT